MMEMKFSLLISFIISSYEEDRECLTSTYKLILKVLSSLIWNIVKFSPNQQVMEPSSKRSYHRHNQFYIK